MEERADADFDRRVESSGTSGTAAGMLDLLLL